MIIFDDFYREEVRRCYKEIEALEVENKKLKERISHFIRSSCDSEWKKIVKDFKIKKQNRKWKARQTNRYSDSGNGGEECSFLMILMKKKQ